MPFQKTNRLFDKASEWLKKELPFVLYRFPNEEYLRGVFQSSKELHELQDYNSSGFVFAPFEKGTQVFIKGEYLKIPTSFAYDLKPSENTVVSEEGKMRHIDLVKSALDEIHQGNLKKVVISRSAKYPTQKSPLKLFAGLLARYAKAMCYLWYHPEVGLWLGATPEQLLRYQNELISTTSLAGTLPYIQGKKPNWTPKELEEQQMVTDYIEKKLQDKIENLNISKPENHRAGELWHLKSRLTGYLKSYDVLPEIVEVLHPTPAVCGLPKKDSMEFILKNEHHNRAYYTGFLGPLNLEGEKEANLFVNLRCLTYQSGNAQLFIGGGITGSSIPEEEWEETQFKSRTILEVL